MSAPRVVLLEGRRHLQLLQRQANRLGSQANALLVRCRERSLGADAILPATLGRCVVLETPGGAVHGEALEAAVAFAVDELRVGALVVVAHTGCSHLPGLDPFGITTAVEFLSHQLGDVPRRRRAAARQVGAGLSALEAMPCVQLAIAERGLSLEGFVHVDGGGALLRRAPDGTLSERAQDGQLVRF